MSDIYDPGPHDVLIIPTWLKWVIGLFVLIWTLGAVGGIWFLVERADAPCEINYAEVPDSPGTFQVLCDD